ncbi:MAG: endonuclease/exonuclease/phosphatase family protein [Verrucomicrobiae bacterium]|nr:endonuclease/exonuclease/phosphatase family protein [Verrucomicrobiae bacterium]
MRSASEPSRHLTLHLAGSLALFHAMLLLGLLNASALTLMTYNVAGNGVEDWSTNSPQVQAIGRQMQYLQPDIVTFQEIPFTNTWQMANFVAAYLPGYYLATNSGTDGYIRSVIVSRFPIVRSRKWLDGVGLTNFGFNGWFTRDLFEAEIAVPGFAQPLHVFTTHLKSGQDTNSAARRAAEASAISNYFVTAFLTTNATRPYVLTGDLNEDVNRSTNDTVRRIANRATGLVLTTPRNPVTGDERTISIRTSLFARYDYILPCTLLASNITWCQVFRTDVITNPPPPLLTTDSRTASDHLPVLMAFANPYTAPFKLLSITVTNGQVSLTWESVPAMKYSVETSTNLIAWTRLATNLTATSMTITFSTNAARHAQYFRIHRTQ